MRKVWLFLLLCLFIFSGCSMSPEATDTQTTDQSPGDSVTAQSDNVTSSDSQNTQSTPERSPEDAYAAFLSESPTLSDLSVYIDQNIELASGPLANQMMQDWIVQLDMSASDRDSVFYGSDSETYFTVLYDVADKLYETTGDSLFMGNQKQEILGLVKDADVKAYLNALFGEGYGLMSSEGLFYTYPDYVYMLEKYGKYTSKSLNAYLEVMVNEIKSPLFAEESLNVSVDELFQRTYYYESLFESTQDLHNSLRMNLSGLLNMCYYRLLVPSSYDMLDDNHRVPESLKVYYHEASVHEETPITAALSKAMLTYFNEKGDVLNVFDDPSIYEHANLYFETELNKALQIGE